MSGRRGRVILAGYAPDLPDLVCVRALDRALVCGLTIGPPGLPADLGNRGLLTLVAEQPMTADPDIWNPVLETLDDGLNVLRWYPDNPLATAAGRQDARDLREAGVHVEMVPVTPPEIIAATFAGVPVPERPRSLCLTGADATETLRIAAESGTPTDHAISQPGTPRQRTGAATEFPTEPASTAFSGALVAERLSPNWFESLPLFGKRILVTRAIAQAPLMSRTLRDLGAQPIELPAIDIIPNPFPEQTSQAASDLPTYDWVIFTSVNGVEIFMECVRQNGYDARQFGNSRIAAIGTATAERLRRHFLEADFVPDEFVAEGIISGLREHGIQGKRILIPRAEVAREALPAGLREAGATVDVVPVYRTIPGTPDPKVLDQLARGEIDVITFTSSSTVTNLVGMLDGDVGHLTHGQIACIGPITAETAREHGLEVAIVPQVYSVPGLIDAICTAMEEDA